MMQGNYRLWDTEEKKYFEPIYDASNGKLSYISMNHRGELLWTKNDHYNTQIYIAHGSTFPNRFIKEFCTGLEDNHKKLVYEGDIIVVGNDLEDRTKTYIVKMNENNIWAAFSILTRIEHYWSQFCCHSYLNQIIGNHRENPELLEAQQ